MTEQAIHTFQRFITENRELLEKLQSNQREMEKLANYMLPVDLQSSHGSVKSGSRNPEFGRHGSIALPLDSMSSALSNPPRPSQEIALVRRRPSSATDRREHTTTVTSQRSRRESDITIKRFPSGDSLHVHPPNTRPSGTIRFIPAPRTMLPPRSEVPVGEEDDENEEDGEDEDDVKTVFPCKNRPKRFVSALEAREDLYGPDDRWYLPRR